MRHVLIYIFTLIVLCSVAAGSGTGRQTARLAQGSSVSEPDSNVVSAVQDSAGLLVDTAAMAFEHAVTVQPDSLPSDTSRSPVSPFVREKVDLDQAVEFSAADSLVLIGDNRAFMYGNSTVKYGEINLNAGRIEMDMDSSTVFASASVPDTVPLSRSNQGLSLIHI